MDAMITTHIFMKVKLLLGKNPATSHLMDTEIMMLEMLTGFPNFYHHHPSTNVFLPTIRILTPGI